MPAREGAGGPRPAVGCGDGGAEGCGAPAPRGSWAGASVELNRPRYLLQPRPQLPGGQSDGPRACPSPPGPQRTQDQSQAPGPRFPRCRTGRLPQARQQAWRLPLPPPGVPHPTPCSLGFHTHCGLSLSMAPGTGHPGRKVPPPPPRRRPAAPPAGVWTRCAGKTCLMAVE